MMYCGASCSILNVATTFCNQIRLFPWDSSGNSMESKVEMPAFHMESFGPLNKQFPFNKIFTALEQGVIFEVSNYLSPHLGRVFVLYTVSMSCAGDLCQRVHILIIHSVVGLQQWNQNTWQRRLISQSQLRRTLFQRQHEGSRIP